MKPVAAEKDIIPQTFDARGGPSESCRPAPRDVDTQAREATPRDLSDGPWAKGQGPSHFQTVSKDAGQGRGGEDSATSHEAPSELFDGSRDTQLRRIFAGSLSFAYFPEAAPLENTAQVTSSAC